MLSLEIWQELFATISKNKLRTFLTGFSVAWGILILIVLLGSGEGLSNGLIYQFRDDAINSIWIRSGTTSSPYRGLQAGRNIQLKNADHDSVAAMDGVEHITSRFVIRGSTVFRFRAQTGTYSIRSVHPGHQHLENTVMKDGRYLNQLDLDGYRKVAVIGRVVEEELFRNVPAVGQWMEVNGIAFRVIGVFTDEGSEREEMYVYLPITTAQRVFAGQDRISNIMFTTADATLEETEAIAAEAKDYLAATHRFSPEDPRAVFVRNNVEQYERFKQAVTNIRLFVWIIGIGTILAGVVGVSNIMMIVVKDRTREIGIRKALGATPGSIIWMILFESVFITSVAGYIGLVMGVAVLELVAKAPAAEFFRNPAVDLRVAISATLVLVISGTVAGFFPARRAAKIHPVEALRDE